MHPKRGRYSRYISPLLIIADTSIIFIVLIIFPYISDSFPITKNVFPKLPKDLYFITFAISSWLIISYYTKFYNIYRFTKSYKISVVLIKQTFFYTLVLLSYFGFLKIEMSRKMTVLFVISIFILIGFLKFLIYYSLKKYRAVFGRNMRNIVIIGNSNSVNQLISFFKEKKELGYVIKGIFNNQVDNSITGNITDSFEFLNTENVDELYCSLDMLEDWQINKYIEIADKNMSTIKFIPNKNSISVDKVSTDFYGVIPVYSLKKPSLNKPFNQFIKRSFDIVFSILILIFVLSWLFPILYILIKLESKGPIFYKHIRYGLNYNEFTCYKFRSLRTNSKNVLDQVTKEDKRLTKIGKFIRKTSIDELPQFFNVLIGDMSVIGPRPHMIPYANLYAKHFDKYKYIFRHSVKPGITGLAQIKGYRGETENDEDIINRIKYDVFYIENWTFIQDINIILQTIIKFVKGDEKAY